MGSCYSGNYIAGNHIYTDIKEHVTLRNHNSTAAFERSVMYNWGA